MKAAIWEKPEALRVLDLPTPKVAPGSVLVKVQSCAICGSDLRIFKHGNERIQAPQVIGHEISGEVVEVGSGVTNFKVGDRISTGADVPCGKCRYCKSQRPNCCATNLAIGYQFRGGFAEYILLDPLVVSQGPVQKFQEDLDFNLAALAEPLGCCLNGYERGLMKPGHRVVIFGGGPIGIMLGLLGRVLNAKEILFVEPDANRAQRLCEFGFKTIDFKNPVETLHEMTNGEGAELIFTACPVVETHEQAVEMVAKQGVINLFGGLPKGTRPISVSSNKIHYQESYLTGSHGSTPSQHKKALELIESNQINLNPLITHHFELKDIAEAFGTAMSKQGLKIIIKPNGN